MSRLSTIAIVLAACFKKVWDFFGKILIFLDFFFESFESICGRLSGQIFRRFSALLKLSLPEGVYEG